MLISLKDFVYLFLYPGQLVEISGVGPDEDDNPIRYEGKQEDIPKKLYGAAVHYVAMSGRDDDPYTVRIECDFNANVSFADMDIKPVLENFAKGFFYPGQEVEIAEVKHKQDVDDDIVRFEGPVDEIPDELKQARVRYIASAARSEAPYTLRVECYFSL